MLTANAPAKTRYKAATDWLDHPDAIVIGSGIGGLGVASFLAQRKGLRVLVLEANAVPGGCTHVHELGGFEFPSGLDSVGDMDASVGRGMNRPNMDEATGGKLEWAKMPDVHEVCSFGDDVYQWHSSVERNVDWVERRFAGQGDVRGYYALEDRIEGSAWAWALTKFYPEWLPVGMREAFYRISGSRWRSAMRETATEALTGRLGFSSKLASVFSYMYGNYGRLPHHAPFGMHATFLAHYRHGAYYPVGGPGQIAECIVPIIERTGGQVAVRSPVERIVVERGRVSGVRLESGEEIRAPLVFSDAGAHATFAELLDRDTAHAYGLVTRFAGVQPSPAHLYLMLGYDEALDLPKHIVWHMARGEGVDPYDIAAADARWKDELRFDDMACYILSPSARDPAYGERYPNRSTLMALAECRPEWVQRCRADAGFKADFEARIYGGLGKIIGRYFPAIAGKTPAFVRAGAPVGCNPRAWNAASYGVELAPERFFSQTHWLRPRTPIRGLFLTGQDAFLPGICGSLLGARFAYAAAMKDPLCLA